MANDPISFDNLDDADSGSADSPHYRPIWVFDLDDNEQILDWLNANLDEYTDDQTNRVQEMRANIARYKNVYYHDIDTRDSREMRDFVSGSPVNRRYKKLSVNHLRDLVNARVARLTQYKPSISVDPETAEHKDEINARIAKRWIDAMWAKNHIETKNRLGAKNADLLGEHFIWIDWDMQKGPIDPDAEANEDGEYEMEDSEGNIVMLPDAPRLGDLVYKVVLPEFVHLEKKTKWEDVNWAIIEEVFPVDELRSDYPDVADQIEPERNLKRFDYEEFQEQEVLMSARKFTFLHRPTKHLPLGLKIEYTRDVILSQKQLPIKYQDEIQGMLPLARMTSEEVPGDLRGISFVRFIRNLQDIVNSLTTMAARDTLLAAHPKWMMPKGAASIKSLGNDYTVVQFQGPVAPQLVKTNPTPSQVFDFRKMLIEEMQQLAKIGGVAAGDPPPGVTAGIALRFLADKQEASFNDQIVKWQQYIIDMAELTLLMIGCYYHEDDKRKLQIVGTNTGLDGQIMDFNPEVFKQRYNVRIKNSSALPESKAARVQTVIDLREIAPNKFTEEMVLEALDLGQGDKLRDQATVNLNAAEYENNLFRESKKVTAPKAWEDHIVHYKQHIMLLQDPIYDRMSKKEQEAIKDHMLAHEMFIYRLSKRNPLIQEQVLIQLPQYPLFLKVEKLDQVMAEEQSLAPGALQGGQTPAEPGTVQAPLEGVPIPEPAGVPTPPPPGQPIQPPQ